MALGPHDDVEIGLFGGAADGRVEVELVDHPRVAAVQVDRAGVHGAVGGRRVDRADQLAGVALDQRHRRAAAADVEVRRLQLAVEPARRAAAYDPLLRQLVEHLACRLAAEQLVDLTVGDRQLVRRTGQLRRENIWVTDIKGLVYDGRTELMDPDKAIYAQ